MASDEENPAPGDYARALVAARRRIVEFALGSALAAVALAGVLPRQYTARVVILPSEEPRRKPPAQTLALASSLGLSLPFGASNATDLYPVLLTSDRLLEPLLDQAFPAGAGRTLQDRLVPDDGRHTEAERRDEALRRLRDGMVRAHKDAESDLVTLHVTTSSPELSAAIANDLAAQFEGYLVGSRQRIGAGKRQFLSSRRQVLQTQLADAERKLTDFRDANRRIDSPQSRLALDRLEREKALRQALLQEILQQEERAKLAETRDTPVARVLEDAANPVDANRPSALVLLALALALGLLLPVSGVILRTAAEHR
jgi:uncharacterized protein involved in exopolysaccharide biosynthesis